MPPRAKRKDTPLKERSSSPSPSTKRSKQTPMKTPAKTPAKTPTAKTEMEASPTPPKTRSSARKNSIAADPEKKAQSTPRTMTRGREKKMEVEGTPDKVMKEVTTPKEKQDASSLKSTKASGKTAQKSVPTKELESHATFSPQPKSPNEKKSITKSSAKKNSATKCETPTKPTTSLNEVVTPKRSLRNSGAKKSKPISDNGENEENDSSPSSILSPKKSTHSKEDVVDADGDEAMLDSDKTSPQKKRGNKEATLSSSVAANHEASFTTKSPEKLLVKGREKKDDADKPEDLEDAWKKASRFDAELVARLYHKYLSKAFTASSESKARQFEITGYLEAYIWPHYEKLTSLASFEHLMSIVVMINTKAYANSSHSLWQLFRSNPDAFSKLINDILSLKLSDSNQKVTFTTAENVAYVIFLNHCFSSVEEPMIAQSFLPLVSLPMWASLSNEMREKQLDKYPKLARHWRNIMQDVDMSPKKDKKTSLQSSAPSMLQRSFIAGLLNEFLNALDSGDNCKDTWIYLNQFLNFIVDLITQLPTRRFLMALLRDCQILTRCHKFVAVCEQEMVDESSTQSLSLFTKFVSMLRFYYDFPIEEQTGQPLLPSEVVGEKYEKVAAFQRFCFKKFKEDLWGVSMGPIHDVCTGEKLKGQLSPLPLSVLQELGLACDVRFSLQKSLPESDDETGMKEVDIEDRRQFLIDGIALHFDGVMFQDKSHLFDDQSLYPTEKLLWDEDVLPCRFDFHPEDLLALPKMSLQFLSFQDYFLRTFQLYRLESSYQIRGDIEELIPKMRARRSLGHRTIFKGKHRRAVPLEGSLQIIRVEKPLLGDDKPRKVVADIPFNLSSCEYQYLQEWEGLRPHDVVFLVSVKATIDEAAEMLGHQTNVSAKIASSCNFPEQYGIMGIRGAQIMDIVDDQGVSRIGFEEREASFSKKKKSTSDKRFLRVSLDAAQYQSDVQQGSDIYDTINLLVRRNPKENNFKAVLETIRALMNESNLDSILPSWFHDLFIGYGNPAAANFREILGADKYALDFYDTFMDVEHIRESFLDYTVSTSQVDSNLSTGCHKLHFNEQEKTITVESYPSKLSLANSFFSTSPGVHRVRFTPKQVKVIQSGMQEGLTLVVGPPGTGKTDATVQTILNLYHAHPEERIVVVTHANQALNDIFEKLAARPGLDFTQLVRLGIGEKAMNAGGDFSKDGRVDEILKNRLALLDLIVDVAKKLEVDEGVAYTCENAWNFFQYFVEPRLVEFETKMTVSSHQNVTQLAKLFPFANLFDCAWIRDWAAECHSIEDSASFALGSKDFNVDKGVIDCLISGLRTIFQHAQKYCPFEVLRTSKGRSDYLLMRHSRIVAMTCTHAAMVRSKLVELNFQFDSVIMEESAQISEIETLIPMCLQKEEPSGGTKQSCRLKRIVLVGDHKQLSPIVQNVSLQHFCRMDQSLFTRMIRLGVPAIHLDRQGRSRTAISALYKWRYEGLVDLPRITEMEEYKQANAGFAHTVQLIDVDAGVESQPRPHFFQNYVEAEFIVVMYQYMRKLGYPAEKITILSTYNGQKELIRQLLRERCGASNLPSRITTVDRYQGQQNDYILISLVRTQSVGHLRDLRRLVVALSRARLGLYVFGHRRLLSKCLELQPVLELLNKMPSTLECLTAEKFPSHRLEASKLTNDEKKKLKLVSVRSLDQFRQIVASLQN